MGRPVEGSPNPPSLDACKGKDYKKIVKYIITINASK